MIPEHLLREIWKGHESFLVSPILLADGASLSVIEAGTENLHRGGPDFLGASFALDGIQISGDVELHITPDGWQAHEHAGDARYSNVVLHVVLEDDSEEHRGPPVPQLVLRDNLAFGRADLWDALFRKLYDRSPELPCFPQNILVPMRFKRKVLEQFGQARLEELIDRITQPDAEIASETQLLERTYQLTMDALGYSQNRAPFRELSALLPISRLRFVRNAFSENAILTFEALFFAVAGLLPKPTLEFDSETNEYLIELNAVWNSIQQSMRFPEVLAEHDWAFFRIRPANSPHRRLALAAMLAERYFSRDEWNFRNEFFDRGPAATLGDNSFWESHTSFASKLPGAQSLLGEERASAIWLNVILPARIARLRMEPESLGQRQRERALIEEWGSTRTKASAKYLAVIEQELLEGENVSSVRSEQGALLLERNFCQKLRCSECPIGHRLIEKGWKPKGV
ncbi:MAG TPA: DUF2851 family protein [Candidatus Kapabacteria bacterium]|nr:DUF2851 family protein [Candidatus Kapabacteria bacterium]